MKIAILTDTHLGANNDHPVMSYTIDKFFDWFWNEVDRREITYVLHGGDILDNRVRVSFKTIQQISRCYLDPIKRLGIEFHGIIGNHDITYRQTSELSCAPLFEGKEGIHLYTKIKDITLPDGTIITMVPWINSENYEETCNHLNETEAKVVLGHLEVKGALMMKGTPSDHGQDASLFSKFDTVFSGHYHHKNSYGNIHYIGNICQMNWGDHGEKRGFTIYDTETGEFELIENPFSPFQKIYYNDAEKSYEDLSFMDGMDFTNLLIKVIVVEKKNPFYLDRFVQKLNDMGAFNVTIVEHDSVEFSGEEVETEDIAEFKADTLTILNEYVTGTAISDEQALRVQTILKELYAEAMSRSIVSEV